MIIISKNALAYWSDNMYTLNLTKQLHYKSNNIHLLSVGAAKTFPLSLWFL